MQEYITIRSVLRCIDLSFPSSLTLLGMQIVEKLSATLEFQEMYASLPYLLFASLLLSSFHLPLLTCTSFNHLTIFVGYSDVAFTSTCFQSFFNLSSCSLNKMQMILWQDIQTLPLSPSLFLPLFSFVLFLTRSVMRGQR